jgi:hypothetical protein
MLTYWETKMFYEHPFIFRRVWTASSPWKIFGTFGLAGRWLKLTSV